MAANDTRLLRNDMAIVIDRRIYKGYWTSYECFSEHDDVPKPVFYPSEALPEGIKWFSYLNPLSLIIENTRDLIMTGVLTKPG